MIYCTEAEGVQIEKSLQIVMFVLELLNSLEKHFLSFKTPIKLLWKHSVIVFPQKINITLLPTGGVSFSACRFLGLNYTTKIISMYSSRVIIWGGRTIRFSSQENIFFSVTKWTEPLDSVLGEKWWRFRLTGLNLQGLRCLGQVQLKSPTMLSWRDSQQFWKTKVCMELNT